MKPKILLTGRNGQVGHELRSLLPRLGKVIALGRQELDLADPEAIRRVIRELRPQLIVNAAAYKVVDQAETDREAAYAINAHAPSVMAEEAKKIGAVLVHYSTDYVFDGLKRIPYEEIDEPNPLNVYGQTKLAGDRAIQAAAVHHLIFRTSWVYATRGRNFLLTVLRLASQTEELRLVDDQIGAPTWSRTIAVATAQILSRFLPPDGTSSEQRKWSGVYHLTSAGETTWYDFAQAILEEGSDSDRLGAWFRAATGGQPLIARRVVPIPTREYPAPAQRPTYSVLANAKLAQTFGIRLPDWRMQLRMAFRDTSAGEIGHMLADQSH